MTTANEIMAVSRNANDAMIRADELTQNVTQDFELETTTYQFEDGSKLIVSGSDVSVDNSQV
jgi:hypothetical protein